jgi:hypothetical protein
MKYGKLRVFILVATNVMFLNVPARAIWMDEEPESDLGRVLMAAQLLRAADVPGLTGGLLLPAQPGTDPLDDGLIQARAKRQVVVALDGAQPARDYDVVFCSYNTLGTRCVSLGFVSTDEEGRVRAAVPFTPPDRAWAGVFVLLRAGAVQYVSGFSFPAVPPPPAVAAAVNIKGQVESVNPQARSFRLKSFAPSIAIDSETKFKGGVHFDDLEVGMTAEVDGTTRQDGSVLASEVKVERHGK